MKLQPRVPRPPSVDLVQEFERFIEEHGIYVMLARINPPMYCPCWNAQTMEASPTCNYCLGTGFKITYERHKVRILDPTIVNDASTRAIQATPFGNLYVPSRFVYFKRSAIIPVGSIIFTLEWNGLHPIKSTMEAYMVNSSSTEYGIGGVPVYKKIGADSRPDITARLFDVDIGRFKVVDR